MCVHLEQTPNVLNGIYCGGSCNVNSPPSGFPPLFRFESATKVLGRGMTNRIRSADAGPQQAWLHTSSQAGGSEMF